MENIDLSSTDSESSDWDLEEYKTYNEYHSPVRDSATSVSSSRVPPTLASSSVTSNAGKHGSSQQFLPPINGNSFCSNDHDLDDQLQILSGSSNSSGSSKRKLSDSIQQYSSSSGPRVAVNGVGTSHIRESYGKPYANAWQDHAKTHIGESFSRANIDLMKENHHGSKVLPKQMRSPMSVPNSQDGGPSDLYLPVGVVDEQAVGDERHIYQVALQGMSSSVAGEHNGEGVGQDTHGNAHRLLSSCQSSKSKKKRSKGRNLNLFDKWAANNSQPLTVEFDFTGRQYKAVGENSQLFIRALSNQVSSAPFHYPSWNKVPDTFKISLFNFLEKYFNLEAHRASDHWQGIVLGIHMDCQRAFKDRRYDMKKHFLDKGGYDDVERAKSHPPEGQHREAWEKIVELFTSEQHKRLSQKGSGNRAKQLYPSLHGSRSYAQRRYLQEQQTGTPSHIETWRKAHYKEEGGWVNSRAEEDWEKIEKQYAQMEMEAGESPVNEMKCMEHALGQRRGHTRGVGRKVKNVSRYEESGVSSSHRDEELETLKKQMHEMQERVRELERRKTNLDNDEHDQADVN